jgi:FKBP-type peptidyl-prolyl cis-trans isomerase FkpA
MKKTIGLAAVVAMIGLTACKDKNGMDKSESGLLYNLVKHDDKGMTAKEGDLITMDVIYKTDKDSVLFDSKKSGRPIQVVLRSPSYKGSLEEGFAMLCKGDSALFQTVADSFFTKFIGAQQLPPFIAKGSYLKFNVKMVDITPKLAFEKQQAQAQQSQQVVMDSLKTVEKANLTAYLSANKITTKALPSGLIFIQNKAGNGAKAEKGKTVSVNYTGTLLDGKMFDTSVEEMARKGNIYDPNRKFKPIEFPLGQGQVIPGWDEAIQMMKVGEKATILLPSDIAYGPNGSGPIPPFSTLKFEVELVGVK